jgi:uncharacterized Zn-binding protein involved in type VI secretion
MNKETLKELVKNILGEESEYKEFFKKALDKAGKSIPDMSDDEKKAFFNKIDTTWDGKGEKKTEGNTFGAERAKAIASGDDSFKVDGKAFKVTGVDAEDKENAEKFANESIGTIALGVAGGLLLLKTLGFVVKKVLGAIGMNVKLPKEKLLQVVEDMTKNVMQNAGGGKVDILHLAKLKSYLMDEIKNGKITNVKQIMQVIDNLSKNDTSVNESELPAATLPASIKAKLSMAVDKIKDSKLSYNQKVQVVGQVMDSLGIDKSEFAKMSSKLKGAMGSSNEGNTFGAERAKAIAKGDDSFKVDGKAFKVTGVDAKDKENAKKFANESIVNEEKYTVIDPKGNQMGASDKMQATMIAKKKGGENAGYFVVSNKNALKARRALEKFKGDFTNPKLKDMMADLFYESVEEANTISEPGEWVAYLSMTRGKKLLNTFNTARGAKQFLSKNVDKLLSGANVESVGIMSKKQWDEREAKYAVESINESLIANDGKILLNGKIVGYYDYDRGSAAFWTTDLSDTQFRGSKAFDTKEEMLAFFKKYISRAAKAIEYKRKALAKFGIKYPADESVNEALSFNGYVSSTDGKTFTLYNSDKKKIKDVSFDDLANKYMKTYIAPKLKDFRDNFDKTTSKGKYFQWWKGKLVNVQLSGMDESVNEAVDVKAGGYRLVSKPDEGVKLYYGGKVIATGFYDMDDWYFWMKHSNWKGSSMGFNNPKEIINYFRAKKITTESVNEAAKPTIKVVNKLKNEEGIQIVVTKTTDGDTMYGGFVVRGKLQKVIPVGANSSKEGVKKRALQIWDEFGKQLGENINEGNAFGMAVSAAKKEGLKEFEFNGKMYKVKTGSYEKNEAAKKPVVLSGFTLVPEKKK